MGEEAHSSSTAILAQPSSGLYCGQHADSAWQEDSRTQQNARHHHANNKDQPGRMLDIGRKSSPRNDSWDSPCSLERMISPRSVRCAA